MLFSKSTFIGVDPTAGVRPFTYAALDHERGLLALGQSGMEEVLAFVAGQRAAVVAVSSPYRPNQQLMASQEVRQSLSPPPRPGRWMNLRLAEYQLRQHNIPIPHTLAREEDCPNWMQIGFEFYRRLENLSYQPYPQSDASHQWLEVYPHASFTALLDRHPFPKHTLEGRLQRQLVLYLQQMAIPDPMLFFEEITQYRMLQGILPTEHLYSPEELDAIMAAYTAWLAANQPEQVSLLGDPQEGQIVLPIPELKARY